MSSGALSAHHTSPRIVFLSIFLSGHILSRILEGSSPSCTTPCTPPPSQTETSDCVSTAAPRPCSRFGGGGQLGAYGVVRGDSSNTPPTPPQSSQTPPPPPPQPARSSNSRACCCPQWGAAAWRGSSAGSSSCKTPSTFSCNFYHQTRAIA